jgi:hypothetical protein
LVVGDCLTSEDQIRELCLRAIRTEDPEEFEIALRELKIAIGECIRNIENKSLHFRLHPNGMTAKTGTSE